MPLSFLRLSPSGLRSLRMLLVCVFLAGGTLLAPTTQAQAIDSTLVSRFRLADSYLRAGQFDRAISLLEDLYDASPGTYAFFDKLKDAYENVKRYDEALTLVDTRLSREPTPSLLSEKGRLFYLANREDEARTAWDEAIALAPDNPNVYRVVYQSLYQIRMFDQAAEILERGREALSDSTLYRNEIAYLYNLTSQHSRAMEEYLALLEADERRESYVRTRLGRFIEQEDALEASIDVTERAVRRSPLNRSFRELMAWLYLEAEAYDKALDANRAIDRLEDEQGRVLFAFARQAADAEAFDVAEEAFSEVLTRHPEAPIAPDALMGLGTLHVQWGKALRERIDQSRTSGLSAAADSTTAPHYTEALATFETFLERYPTHPYYPDALREMGRLYQTVFFDLDAAEEVLNRIISTYPRSTVVHEAAYELGRIALLRGELDEARLALGRLEESLRTGELAEKSRYELALIHLYRGEWDAAQTLAQAMQGNTGTDVANNAIELKVLLFENKGPDSLNVPLRLFAEARLLERQRKPEEALGVLDSLLATYGNHALADDVRYARGHLLRNTGDPEAALATLGEIPLVHPRSFLVDRALFLIGEIQEQDLNQPEEAIETYTQLLTDYPGSLLASTARTRIRILRGDGA